MATASAARADDATEGFMAGDFAFLPSLSVSEEYNDNIYTEDRGETDDFLTRIKPELLVKKTGSPNKLEFKLAGEQVLYTEDSDDNYFNYLASIRSRYKIAKGLTWDAFADHRRGHSTRGDDQANPTNDASEPLPYDVTRVNTSLTKEWAAFKITPKVAWTRYDYGNVRRMNGTLINQDYRDRDAFEYGARLEYDLKNDFVAFADAILNPINYDQTSPTDRDSDGGTALVGFRYRPSKEILGELGLGYMERDYDNSVYDDINGLAANARWDWTYAEGSQVRLNFRRTLDEATDNNVGGYVRSDVTATVTKLLMDDLTGRISGRYSNYDYEGGNGADDGSDREDKFYEAAVGLDYNLADNTVLTASYAYNKNNSNRDTSDWKRNVILLGIKAGF